MYSFLPIHHHSWFLVQLGFDYSKQIVLVNQRHQLDVVEIIETVGSNTNCQKLDRLYFVVYCVCSMSSTLLSSYLSFEKPSFVYHFGLFVSLNSHCSRDCSCLARTTDFVSVLHVVERVATNTSSNSWSFSFQTMDSSWCLVSALLCCSSLATRIHCSTVGWITASAAAFVKIAEIVETTRTAKIVNTTRVVQKDCFAASTAGTSDSD